MQRAALHLNIASSRNASADLAVPRLVMLVSTLALLLIGFVMVYSAGSIKSISAGGDGTYYLIRQLIAAGAGIGVALVVWGLVPFQTWGTKLIYIIWAAVVALFLLTALCGDEVLGAKRWISIGGVQFQPSEFAKIAIVMNTAYSLDRYLAGEFDMKGLLKSIAVLVGVPIVCIFGLQSDMGTTVIAAVGIVGALWMSGLLHRIPHRVRIAIAVVVTLVVIAFIVFAGVVAPYRFARIFVFLDPWNDGENGTGTGYQLIHSLYAFSEGGVFGTGIGNSAEKYLYLPESQTDFAFSVLGEEFGLVGCVVVLGLFLAFLWAGLRIAEGAATPYSAMVAGGLIVMIVFQAFLNICCVTGLLPTTGKPLPFISYGGSSEMATLIMVGLIMAVSDESVKGASSGARRDGFRAIRGGRI